MAEPPLKGIRVIELARILAGPWAGQLLADLGADVIKVENPEGGDDTRTWGPPFVKGRDGENLSAAYYHSCNRGKRSIALDFSTPEGAATVRKLVATADVLIENFKLGGLKKYGLDYAALHKINPRLVDCSITGFGQDGPYAPRPGYDFIIQGMAGMMSITGAAGAEPEGRRRHLRHFHRALFGHRHPGRTATCGGDRPGSVYRHGAVRHTDLGARQSEPQLSRLGKSPVQMGNAHMNIAPYEVVPVRDGHIILAVGNDGQFQRFCHVVDLNGLPGDPDFATNAARVGNRARLRAAIVERLADYDKAPLLASLEAAGVPASPINTIGEMFADPQAIARGMRLDLDDGHGNKLPSVRAPMLMSETPPAYNRPSPRLGEHTHEILAELERHGE